MDGGGFEPPKQFAADLQSVPFGHSGIHPYDRIFITVQYLHSYNYSIIKADDRTRTLDTLIKSQVLYQLS